MLHAVGQIYASLAPAIFAAVLNMVWVKTRALPGLARPIDGWLTLGDGRRLLGDNKTWKGLLGVTVLGAVTGWLWGAALRGTAAEPYDLFFLRHQNTHAWAAGSGALLGFTYGLFELPNSFLKRRVGITPGLTKGDRWSWVFVVLDQIDSVLGCALVLALFAPVSFALFLAIVVLGGLTHFLLNLVLYALRLRRTPL